MMPCSSLSSYNSYPLEGYSWGDENKAQIATEATPYPLVGEGWQNIGRYNTLWEATPSPLVGEGWGEGAAT